MNDSTIFPDQAQRPLPNSTTVLVLGIVSIILCCCYGGGIITSVIALILANKDFKLYNAAPQLYTSGSYSNLKAGKICAIISLIFSALFIVLLIVTIATVGVSALSDPEAARTIFQ